MTNWIWLYEKKLAINMEWNWIESINTIIFVHIIMISFFKLLLIFQFYVSVELKNFDMQIYQNNIFWKE